ncbi:MAG: hypothetical protein GY859_20255 [Desulfobacterales bacterium]|nr:hypothetical protein [Desulfobacterales bacterium]
MSDFTEVRPGGRPFKRAYLAFMLWFVGRAIQAAAKVDKDVKREFEELPEGFTFTLGAAPDGPVMVVGKKENGAVKYLGWKTEGLEIDLKMTIKNLEAFFMLFTFQESTPVSNSRDRMFVEGEVPTACAAVRILDIVQVHLLPPFIAKLAIKRYPRWPWTRHLFTRGRVYLRTILGF